MGQSENLEAHYPCTGNYGAEMQVDLGCLLMRVEKPSGLSVFTMQYHSTLDSDHTGEKDGGHSHRN